MEDLSPAEREARRRQAFGVGQGDPQLLPGGKAHLQWRGRGPEQQGQSHHEKILGFRTYRVLELALYHSLGKLPEPESTHGLF